MILVPNQWNFSVIKKARLNEIYKTTKNKNYLFLYPHNLLIITGRVVRIFYYRTYNNKISLQERLPNLVFETKVPKLLC